MLGFLVPILTLFSHSIRRSNSPKTFKRTFCTADSKEVEDSTKYVEKNHELAKRLGKFQAIKRERQDLILYSYIVVGKVQ